MPEPDLDLTTEVDTPHTVWLTETIATDVRRLSSDAGAADPPTEKPAPTRGYCEFCGVDGSECAVCGGE